MPASPWFPDLETLGSGVGGVILSSRVRDGNQACKGWGPWGDAPGQPPREQSQDPSPSYRKALGERAGRESTRAPNHPACLAGSPSWELEGGTAGWTGGNTASTVAHPATSKHPVLSPPPQPPGTGWCWKCCGVKLFPGTVGVLGWNSGAVAEYNSLRMPPGGATCNGRLCSMAPL